MLGTDVFTHWFFHGFVHTNFDSFVPTNFDILTLLHTDAYTPKFVLTGTYTQTSWSQNRTRAPDYFAIINIAVAQKTNHERLTISTFLSSDLKNPPTWPCQLICWYLVPLCDFGSLVFVYGTKTKT